MKQKNKNDKPSNQIRSISQLRINFNLRVAFGVLLICTSFISAYVLSKSTDRMITVWSAAKDLAPGSVIQEEDISPTQVLMPNNAEFYLDGRSSILGSQVVRAIGSAELIPAFAVSSEPIIDLRSVPISIPVNRLPYQINSGQIVDVYVVPKQQINTSLEDSISKSFLLLSSVSISGIDLEAGKLGGEIAVTLLVPKQFVSDFISAISKFDFVLVKTP